MLSRGRTNHGRRHCQARATLPAQLAADCTSDASASASDENSAALELHEPIVPLAERPPGCARDGEGQAVGRRNVALMRGRWETTRTEAFSDGVFSIASTLLVLDIAIPASELDDLWSAIAHQWPPYLAYATSFITIGGIWLAHHSVFSRLQYTGQRRGGASDRRGNDAEHRLLRRRDGRRNPRTSGCRLRLPRDRNRRRG